MSLSAADNVSLGSVAQEGTKKDVKQSKSRLDLISRTRQMPLVHSD